MPGETISQGDLDSLYVRPEIADKWPKYHVSIVSRTQLTQGGGATMKDYALSNRFNILLSSDSKDSGHKDNVVIGMLWHHYHQIKAHTRGQAARDAEVDVSHIGSGATLTKTSQEAVGISLLNEMPLAEGDPPEAPPVEASEE